MTPVLSTRIFGRLPGPTELQLARQAGFLDLEVWLEQLPDLDEGKAQRFANLAREKSFRLPCVHLSPGRLGTGPARGLAAREALEPYLRALDIAHRWGSRYAICHLGLPDAELADQLCQAASEQALALAFELDTVPGSGAGDLLRLLRDLGPVARGHGLCLDLSRSPTVDRKSLARVGNHVIWLEVAGHRGDVLHTVPAADDRELLQRVEACSGLPYVAYEVVSAGPPGLAAGAAQLTVLLRQIHLFHIGGGHTTYEGAPPFLPMG